MPGKQGLNFSPCRKSTAAADRTRLQRRNSRGKTHALRQRAALKQTMNVTAMKSIATSSGIDSGHGKSRLMESHPTRFLPPATAVAGGNHRGATTGFEQLCQLLRWCAGAGILSRKLLAHHQMIDQRQQRPGRVAQRAAIENGDDASVTSTPGRGYRRIDLLSVEVQNPGGAHQVEIELMRLQRSGAATMAEDGPPSLPVDGNESDLAAPLPVSKQSGTINSFFNQSGANSLPEVVATDPTTKCCRHAKAPQRNEGGGHRPTALDLQLF